MDIVDNNCCANKYINKTKKRHVCNVNDVGFWININAKYINKKTKLIVNIHKQFLNQKKYKTIKKCIEHNINICPIIYWMKEKIITLLVSHAFEYYNIFYIKYFSKCIHIENYIKNIYLFNLCINNRLDIIKLMNKNEMPLVDMCRYSCEYNYFRIIKYLHKKYHINKYHFNNKYTIKYLSRRQKICKYLERKNIFQIMFDV